MGVYMQVSSSDNKKKYKLPQFNRALLNTLLLILIVITFSATIGGLIGYQFGKKAGAQATIGKVTDLLNPLNAISDNPLFPSTTVGKVYSIDGKTITVLQPNGNKKKISLSDKTKITEKDRVISTKEVKKDSSVTVFTTGKGDSTIASRVVVR